jgi:hypothetical protein
MGVHMHRAKHSRLGFDDDRAVDWVVVHGLSLSWPPHMPATVKGNITRV